MKKVLKRSLVLLVLLVVMCIMTGVYAAFTCTVSMQTSKSEFNKNDEFVVDVNLSDIQTDRGINLLGAILEYDKNSLTLVKMEGKNTWSTPSYNEANGKLTTDRNGFATTNETIFQITFKVNDQANKNTTITLKNIEVADGNQEKEISNATKSITIKNGTNMIPSDNTNFGTNTNQAGNKNTTNNVQAKDNTVTSGNLPKTGENRNIIIPVVLIGAIVSIVIFYSKNKFMNIK